MKPDYQNIRTLAQLDEAIAGNRKKVVRMEIAIKESAARLQAVYTPQNLLGEGVRRFSRTYTFQTLALSMIGRLRKRLMNKK